LISQDSVVLLLSNLKQSTDKFVKSNIAIFILIKKLEYLEKIEVMLPGQLTLDLLSLFLHEDLILEELGQLLQDCTWWRTVVNHSSFWFFRRLALRWKN